MSYQISWETFLVVSAACVLLYYGLVLTGTRKLRARWWKTGTPNGKSTVTGKTQGSQHPQPSPAISAEALNQAVSTAEDILEEAVDLKLSKGKFLLAIERGLGGYETEDQRLMVYVMTCFLRRGSKAIGIPLTSFEIEIALGIPESSPAGGAVVSS